MATGRGVGARPAGADERRGDPQHQAADEIADQPVPGVEGMALGEDRVLYAMDYPYQCPVEEVIALDNMDMPLETKKKFFQTNAEHVFRLA